MYKTVLFDLDGTLTDSKPGIFRALRGAMGERGAAFSDDFLRCFLGPPIIEGLTELAGFNAAEAVRVKDRFRVLYKAVGIYENEILPGIVSLLRRLKDRGVRLGVATSKPERAAKQVLDRFSLTGFFDCVSAAPSDGEDGRKSAVIRAALDALSVDAREKPFTAMVGDRKYDCLGAAENGIDAVGFTAAGYAEEGELEGAGAKFVTADPEALFRFLTEGNV